MVSVVQPENLKTWTLTPEFEAYSDTSKVYDDTRQPIDLDWLVGFIEGRTGKHISEVHLFDGGCGTGTYLQGLFERGLAKATGLEYNEGMLAEATKRLAKVDMTLQQGSVAEIPHPDASFDVVMTTQVFHHLDDATVDASWPNTLKALQEMHRVCKPGGLLIMNVNNPQQQQTGFWWAHLIKDAILRQCERCIQPRDLFLSHMAVAGWKQGGFRVSNTPLMGKMYHHYEGPLDADWRKGDSSWSMATPEEIALAEQTMWDLKSKGELERWVQEKLEEAKIVGQSTWLFAQA